MRCPLCTDEHLEAHHRSGIEIDICPRCRGVWLDRGELDRLVREEDDVATTPRARPAPPPPAPTPPVEATGPVEERRRPSKPPAKPSKKKRRKSWASRLEDVFDEILDL